jgi:DUF4097 and DUF4098 domain-containing protein YvlB
MKRTVPGTLIVLFLVFMAVMRWGPVLTSGGRGYRFDRQGKTATAHLDGDILTNVQNIVVDNRYGKVRVEATDGTPGWSWDLTCWADTVQTADFFTRQIDMRAEQRPDRSSWTLVLPNPPTPQLRGVESKLTLRVPASVRVDLRNCFGETEVVGVQGGTLARCQHGRLQLSRLTGNVDAETSFDALSAQQIAGAKLVNHHGPLTATDVEGDLDARTEHGDVNVHRVAGNLKVNSQFGKVIAGTIAGQAEIQTSYADIEVEDLGGKAFLRNRHGGISGHGLRGSVEARNEFHTIDLDVNCPEVVCTNQHGKIRLRLADPKLRSVRAETSYADLELNICEPLAPKIEAQTSNGSLKSDFPVYAMGTGTNNFQGLGASAARITLKNQYGNIRIRKSPKSDSGH